MLVAAAVCPCPPLLVPEIAAGAAPELDAARAACEDAIGVLVASRPDRLVVVGPLRAQEQRAGRNGDPAGAPVPYPQGTPGSFRGFGVGLDVRLGTPAHSEPDEGSGAPDEGSGPDSAPADGAAPLPASLAVAARLLERAGRALAPLEGLAVGELLAPGRCLASGRELAASAPRVALLVMGDGSACRTLKAPGYLDERAPAYDAALARALGNADTAALAALDPGLARDLMVSGRAPWQVLAGAAEDAGLGGTLLHEEAPYGVGYVVAAWS